VDRTHLAGEFVAVGALEVSPRLRGKGSEQVVGHGFGIEPFAAFACGTYELQTTAKSPQSLTLCNVLERSLVPRSFGAVELDWEREEELGLIHRDPPG
jgi:hypothetical protein